MKKQDNARYLAEKLRCSNTPHPYDCAACEYRTEERIPFMFRKMADFWRDYEPYCIQCDYERIGFDAALALEKMETYGDGWIPVDNLMPEEKESIFAKLHGTDCWIDRFMWRKLSANVLVTAEYKSGNRIVFPCSTHDGEWNVGQIPIRSQFVRIVAWMPYPDAYGGGNK